ncbi:hemerythrin domain-containing protein [Garciella nitratireducens]|uniref:Hemerythrin-like domain-containing protein n=1 Tax=Garciella nitratireducens DSM 15102 TaxID=1121911 RepID=A0A1T4LLV5_9FIRM|nr:hemerythrin domain-containing protein [Garciella nitratireducens]SJZ55577.1 Hemerythrin-like domain-containing protein [Garciella nitratireducens DSM 15102]
MKSIDILVEEHSNIQKMLEVIRRACFQIVEGGEINHQDFLNIVDFIRNYADKYHHKKEEDMLFVDMGNDLGEPIKNGPIQGMLVEHDMGRRFVRLLEEAVKEHQQGKEEAKLDIIANAIGYQTLLADHIEKENTVLYQMAIRNLKDQTKDNLDRKFQDYEQKKEHQESREKYITFVKRIQKKYL